MYKSYPKHVPKPYQSAFEFALNLILKAVLGHQNSKTGTFQNSWKISYLSNIPVTYICVIDIYLGNNNPQPELIYYVLLILEKMSNFALSWKVPMFFFNFSRIYCSNTVGRIKWFPLFCIWAIWEKYQLWPTNFLSRSKSRWKMS